MFRTISGERCKRARAWMAAAIGLCAAGWAAGSTAEAATSYQGHVAGSAKSLGVVNLSALASGAGGGPPPAMSANAIPKSPSRFETLTPPYGKFPGMQGAPTSTASRAAASASVAASGLTTASGGSVKGFNGIDHYDQRIIADHGNQFSLEPPDQALAVGNGFVLEAVNNAIDIYDTTGAPLLKHPVSMNIFMNQVSEINRKVSPVQFGPGLSDPRAYYDADTQRFFVVEWATLNNADGSPLGIAVQFIAVSASSDPTQGWYIYSFETTQSGVNGCPCFGDFQMLGADRHGIYISMNLFNIFNFGYAGDKIYAMSKAALESGAGGPLVAFPRLTQDFAIHPTIPAPGSSFASEAGGTEYMLEETSDLSANTTTRRVNVWAISNTKSLAGPSPSLTMTNVSVKTEDVTQLPFGLPPALQMDGPRPLGNALGDPVPLLNADDARFASAPVYVNGQIWAAVGTATAGDTVLKNTVAWFEIAAHGGTPALTASVTKQGYISAPGDISLLYPTVAMTTSGAGGIGVTLSGPANFPSTAYVPLSASTGAGVIQIVGAGHLPEDGFTAYPQEYPPANGVARWGDYGAAAADETGGLWFANEYIPNTNKYPRSALANWGTFITNVKP
jgi:hypothetical protein